MILQYLRRYSLIRTSFRFLVNVTPTTTEKELNEMNKLMKTYNNTQIPIRTIALFEWMLNITNIKPNFLSYLHTIRACSELNNLNICEKIHEYIKNDQTLENNQYNQLQIKLIYMYGKINQLELAEEIFYRIKTKIPLSLKSILFGTMFKAYNMNGQAEKTIDLYKNERFQLDAISATCLLNAASDCHRLDIGENVYNEVNRLKLLHPPNIRLTTAIMDMYCNCGSISRARELFNQSLPTVDHIAYSTLMKAYLSNNQPTEILELFKQFQSSSLSADSVFYLNIIHAGYKLGLIHQAEYIHHSIPSSIIEKNHLIQINLIDMHAHCLHLNEAYRLFDLLKEKNKNSLGNLIHAYAIHGQGRKALKLFEENKSQLKFNEQIYKMILYACAFTGGLIDQATEIYKNIPEKYKTPEVAAVMVSILARASLFKEVLLFIDQYQSMSTNTFPLWSVFFMVCYHSGNISYGKLIYDHIKNDNYLSLLCADMTNSVVSKEVLNHFQEQEVGKCWTEIKNDEKNEYIIHEFNDNDLENFPALNSELNEMINELKSVNISWDSQENDLKELFCGHTSIRLGIAQNLISTLPKTSFQLTKTKPLCSTCHEGIKQLTLLRQRDIILRDNIRVHHFHNGQCSCHDQF